MDQAHKLSGNWIHVIDFNWMDPTCGMDPPSPLRVWIIFNDIFLPLESLPIGQLQDCIVLNILHYVVGCTKL